MCTFSLHYYVKLRCCKVTAFSILLKIHPVRKSRIWKFIHFLQKVLANKKSWTKFPSSSTFFLISRKFSHRHPSRNFWRGRTWSRRRRGRRRMRPTRFPVPLSCLVFSCASSLLLAARPAKGKSQSANRVKQSSPTQSTRYRNALLRQNCHTAFCRLTKLCAKWNRLEKK